jgi:rubredoxin
MKCSLSETIFQHHLEVEMEKWKCTVCGYIYDPGKGDPDGDIPPDTPFEKLPDSWVCPACGAPKDMFEKA